jgi:hypothetical protein
MSTPRMTPNLALLSHKQAKILMERGYTALHRFRV